MREIGQEGGGRRRKREGVGGGERVEEIGS